MQEEIIEKYSKIKQNTIKHINLLLDEINISKNKELEAEIEQLKNELKEIKKLKKYWLVWEEKQELFDKETIWKLPVLKEVKENDVFNNESESNILIEWDNYHALSVLNYTHKWKIDVIYIDPPYNTWNKDFIYNDKIIEKEDKFKHSSWLSFMSKRIKLAKNLLSDKWVIFISIDDNEFAQLKLLCDEIFWEENFIENFSWNRTKTPANLSKKSRKVLEYILCYSSNYNNFNWLLAKTKTSNTANWILWQTSTLKTLTFPKNTINTWINNWILKKWMYKSANYEIELLEDTEIENWFFIKDIKLKWKFSWTQKKLNEEILNWTKISIRTKSLSPGYIKKQSNLLPPKNLINEEYWVLTSENWTYILKNILWENSFTFPKPPSLISFLIKLINNKNSIILDFFAGSWTTGHAVLELNKEDWWNRKFILATNNENNICKEVTYERVKRVMNWYKNSKWENIKWLSWNLKYLKTDFIDKHKSNDDLRIRMVNRCSELLCLKENIWEEVNQKNSKIKLFKRKDKYLAILYDMFYFNEFKKILYSLDKQVSIYAFSHYKLLKEDFEDIWIPFEIEDIPDPILEVYDTIFWL